MTTSLPGSLLVVDDNENNRDALSRRLKLKGYTVTKGALHFSVDCPLPKTVVKKLISVRLGEVRPGSC